MTLSRSICFLALLFAACASFAQGPIGMILGVHGDVSIKPTNGDKRSATELSDLYAGDIIVVRSANARLSFFGSGTTMAITGTGSVKCSARTLKLVSGKVSVSAQASRAAKSLPTTWQAGTVTSRDVNSSAVQLLSPVAGQRTVPTELRWTTPLTKPDNLPPGTPDIKVIVVLERLGSRPGTIISQDNLDLTSTTIPLPQLAPGQYRWTVRITGFEKTSTQKFVVVSPETQRSLADAEAVATTSGALLDLATTYRYYMLFDDADRIYTQLQTRFGSDPMVREAIARWKESRP